MATFRLEIDCEGAAFGEDGDPVPEVRRILKTLIVGDKVRAAWEDRNKYGSDYSLMDHNGLRVGHVTFSEGE